MNWISFFLWELEENTQEKFSGAWLTPDHLFLDSAPNIGPLISCWELNKFKNCWSISFRTSEILTLLYQQFLNLLISQRNMSGPRLGALSNNRWSGGYLRFKAALYSYVLPEGEVNGIYSQFCFCLFSRLRKKIWFHLFTSRNTLSS